MRLMDLKLLKVLSKIWFFSDIFVSTVQQNISSSQLLTSIRYFKTASHINTDISLNVTSHVEIVSRQLKE